MFNNMLRSDYIRRVKRSRERGREREREGGGGHFASTYVGCPNFESNQNVPDVFVTEVKYSSKEMEMLNILYIVNLVLLLLC